MNGPDTLSVKEPLAIVKAWMDAKSRRRVKDHVNIPVPVTHSGYDLIEENEPDGDFNSLELAGIIHSDSFWL